jgi:hypothetical protein
MAPRADEIDWDGPPLPLIADEVLGQPNLASGVRLGIEIAQHYQVMYLISTALAHDLRRATMRVVDERDALRAEVRRLNEDIRRLRQRAA